MVGLTGAAANAGEPVFEVATVKKIVRYLSNDDPQKAAALPVINSG